MILSNLKPALRQFKRNKLHAVINILGLSIGMAACLVIYLITHYELGFDTFRQDRDRIYRLYSRFSGTFEGVNRGVAAPLGAWCKENLKGVDQVAPMHTYSARLRVVQPDGALKDMGNQPDISRVTPDFFHLFGDYKWLSGSPETALSEPYTVVLTDKKAKLYFGLDDPSGAIGKQLLYGDSLSVTVTGIVREEVRQTDLYFNDFISFATIEAFGQFRQNISLNEWGNTNSSSQLFIKLAQHTEAENVQAQLKGADEAYKKTNNEWGFAAFYRMQPLSELHFDAEIGIFDQTPWSSASKPTMHLLVVIAALLLLIAAINFINLETAQSTLRAKEIGVRKALGSSRGALIRQFLSETFILTAVSVGLSVVLTQWALGYFKEFIPEGVRFQPGNPGTLAFLLATTIGVTLVAGSYPAFILSAFRPALALKDRVFVTLKGSGSLNLRRGLVVFQFIVAQVLILGTLAVGGQIRYMLNKDLGFDQDALIQFSTPWQDTTGRKSVLYQELRNIPGVLSLSLNDGPPAESGYSSSVIKYNNGKEEVSHNVYRKFGDTAFIRLYDLEMLAGRNVLPSDTVKEFIINETYARQLGFATPADAINKMLTYQSSLLPIVGVVKDFHIFSLHQAIEPVAIACAMADFTEFGLKLQTKGRDVGNFTTVLEQIKEKWTGLYPEDPFTYVFLDESIAKFYEAEQRTSKLAKTATLMAILLSCLGLLGLVSFSAVQRTREIGIRKVLGASVASIVSLLSQEFIWLIGIAFVIAAPLAWYFAQQWLDKFAYHFNLNWTLFILTGLIAVAIAFLTMSIQSIRAARANPAESLKSE